MASGGIDGARRRRWRIDGRWWLLGTILATVMVTACGQASYTAEEHLDRAAGFEEKGDLSAALIELKTALQKDPGNVDGRFRLGLLLLTVGDVSSAEHELVRARDLGMNADQIMVPLLRVWHLQERHDRILDETSQLARVPESHLAEILALRGHALMGTGDIEGAERALRSALDREPDLVSAMTGMARLLLVTQKDLAQAQAWVDRALAVDPGSPQALELLGDLEHSAGRTTEAEAAYGMALQNGSAPVSSRVKRAFVRVYLGDYAGAEEDAEILRSSYRNHPAVNQVRGLIAFNQGRFADARTEFEAVLAVNPDYMPAVFHLGASHVALGSSQQADSYLSRYLAAYPESREAARILAMMRLGKGDLEQAERLVQPLLGRTPDDPVLLNLMGSIELARGDPMEGLAHLQRVAALRPDDASARATLGIELLRAGEQEEGLRQLESALELAPDSRDLEVTLIINLIRARQFDRAAVAVEQLRAEIPDSPLPDNLRGAIDLALGDPLRASESFRSALDRAPGDPVAILNLGMLARQRGEHGEAREWFGEGLRHHPGNLDLLMRAARLESEQGETVAMMALLEQAVQAHPEAPAPRLVLGEHLLSVNQPQPALALLEPLSPASREQEVLHLELTARAHLAAGQTTQAVQSLRGLASMIPDTAEARARLGAAFAQAGNMAEAEAQARRALSLEAGHEGATRLLAQIGQQETQEASPDQLLARARQLQQQAPEDPRGYVFEGRIHTAQGNHEAAIRAYRAAYELNPAVDFAIVLGLAYQRAGLRQEAIELFTAHLAEHGEDGRLLGALGEAQVNARAYGDAVETLERVVQLLPDSAGAQFVLARAYAGAGDAAKFRSALDRAVTLDPNHVSAGMTRVRLDLEEGLVDQARRHQEALLRANPEHPEVLALGGEIALRDGRPGDAATQYRQALEYRAEPQWVIQAARAQSLDGQADEAARTLDEWLRRRPGDLGVRYVLGEIYVHLRRFDDARHAFEAVVEQRPDNFLALNNLAWLLRESDPGMALRLAERAHALAPEDPSIKDTLGTVLLEHPDEHARAVRLLREAAATRPENLSTRFHLAVGLARIGERDEAVIVLDGVLADGREFPEIEEARSLLDSLGG